MKTLGALQPTPNATALENHVREWINEQASEYPDTGPQTYNVAGVLNDLMRNGCQSGYVGDLIYYADTLKFYKRHKLEINQMLIQNMADMGAKSPADMFGDKWDLSDPLALDTINQNLLAWFGFEETARKLAEDAGLEL